MKLLDVLVQHQVAAQKEVVDRLLAGLSVNSPDVEDKSDPAHFADSISEQGSYAKDDSDLESASVLKA